MRLTLLVLVAAATPPTASAQILALDGTPNTGHPTFYAWFDAADGVNGAGAPADGTAVTHWNDRTGQGRDLLRVSTNPAQRPVFRTAFANGHPAVDFDGDAYIWGNNSGEFGTITGAKTIFIVTRADAASGGYAFDGTSASQRNAFFTGQTANPAQWVVYTGNEPVTANALVGTGVFRTHSMTLDQGASEHFINGASNATGTTALAPLGGLILGSRYSVGHFFVGAIAEILVYDAVLSAADRQAIEGYLLGKHPPVDPPPPPPVIDVFDTGDGLYAAYRIPAIVTTQAGTVLAFAEGRESLSDHAKNDIVMRRSIDGGDTWGPIVVLHDDGDNSLNNPCAVQLHSGPNAGRVLLMYQRYPQGCHESCVVPGYSGPNICRSFLMISDDDGVTWSAPHETTAQVKPPVATSIAGGPGVGIQKRRAPHAGRVIFPFNRGPNPNWKVYAVYSDDGGATWAYGQIADDSQSPGVGNEVQMAELADGSVLLNSRSNAGTKHRKIAHSLDGGATWTPLVDETQLVEPQCMASTLRYTDPIDGMTPRLLYAGPNSQASRVKGTVWMSYDEGQTWPIQREIWPGGYAYSVLSVIDDQTIGVLFERDNYQHISLTKFDLQWLTQGDDCVDPAQTFTTHGPGCPGVGGVVPTLSFDGCFAPKGKLSYSVTGPPNTTAFVLVGVNVVATPLPNGCLLRVSPILPVIGGPLALGAAGVTNDQVRVPATMSPGTHLVIQGWTSGVSAGEFALSNAVEMEIP